MEKHLETHRLLKLTKEKTENLSNSVVTTEIDFLIKSHPTEKTLGLTGLISESCQISLERKRRPSIGNSFRK